MRRRDVGWRLGREDDGQMVLLTLVYTLVAFSLVIVAVDATAVHLARTQLLDAADGAALDAADGLDLAATYAAKASGPTSDPQRRLTLTDGSVRQEVQQYLADYATPSRIDDVTVASGTGTDDGHSATVVLTARVRLPIGGAVVASWSEGVTVTVRSRAQSPLF